MIGSDLQAPHGDWKELALCNQQKAYLLVIHMAQSPLPASTQVAWAVFK